MSRSSVPDNWERDSGGPIADIASNLSFLNVNASSFVPTQSVPARETRPFPPHSKVDQTAMETDPTEDTPNSGSYPVAWDEPEMSGSLESEDGEADDELIEVKERNGDESKKVKAAKKKSAERQVDLSNRKEHVNIVFIGHVDAGKSTIGGQLLYLTGMVDKRMLEKYKMEATEKNRETWYLSWALDTNLEERDKGKTVEVGRAYFETEKRHFTILDAPGHKSFVPNMIGGASQADVAILVISARKGEFETGFERGGQTREHAQLVKAIGVKHLVVLINKMDDVTVNWSEERYNECVTKLTPFLKKSGFNPKTDLYFLPCSGLAGYNLMDRIPKDVCPFYDGPSFIEYLDQLKTFSRDITRPLRICVFDKCKDKGTVLLGKVECGLVSEGDSVELVPGTSKTLPGDKLEVSSISVDGEDRKSAVAGETIRIMVKGVDEDAVSSGMVLCPFRGPYCSVTQDFDAQVMIREYKSIICAGFSCIMHLNNTVTEVELTHIICVVDKKTGKMIRNKPVKFIKEDMAAVLRFHAKFPICLEKFKDFPQLGRFALREEQKSIAYGIVVKILDSNKRA